MDPKTAGELLSCNEETEEFHERWIIIQRMNTDEEFAREVVKYFKPPY